MADTEARAVLFHGLADRSRLAIIEALVPGPRRVSDLVEQTGLSQSNASRHLACLWECGLVEREGSGARCTTGSPEGLAPLLAAVDDVLSRTGDRVTSCPRYGRPPVRAAA